MIIELRKFSKRLLCIHHPESGAINGWFFQLNNDDAMLNRVENRMTKDFRIILPKGYRQDRQDFLNQVMEVFDG